MRQEIMRFQFGNLFVIPEIRCPESAVKMDCLGNKILGLLQRPDNDTDDEIG